MQHLDINKMEILRSFFSYMFYRITKAYFKWDGRQGFTAILAISMFQILIIGCSVILILRIFIDRSQLQNYSYLFKNVAVFLGFLLVIFNYRTYSKNYSRYKERWKNESKPLKYLKGILIILTLIFPWVLVYLISK